MDASERTASDEMVLIYDGNCPVCTAYSGAVDVSAASAQSIRRIDARGDHSMVKTVTALGLDLDEGMIVSYRSEFYHGADALHLLATLTPATGIWNRVNRFMFRSRTVSRILYPVLRFGRNLLLRLLGRKTIGNLKTLG